jgi:uncharacterized protein (TIGR03435 family)
MTTVSTNSAARNRLRILLFLALGATCAPTPASLAQIITPQGPTQNAPEKLLEFEVATIKPTAPDSMQMVGVNVYPGGRVVIESVPLKTLISIAFNVSWWQISGGDQWIDKTEFNVEAKPPEAMRASLTDLRHSWYGIDDERLRQMLQALLIDRFQLKFHRQTKTGQVFLLEKSGKTPQLKPTSANPADANTSAYNAGFGSIGFAGTWVLYNTSMPQLAKFASDFALHCPVLDQTGLTGTFDYRSPPEDWDVYQSDTTG